MRKITRLFGLILSALVLITPDQVYRGKRSWSYLSPFPMIESKVGLRVLVFIVFVRGSGFDAPIFPLDLIGLILTIGRAFLSLSIASY